VLKRSFQTGARLIEISSEPSIKAVYKDIEIDSTSTDNETQQDTEVECIDRAWFINELNKILPHIGVAPVDLRQLKRLLQKRF